MKNKIFIFCCATVILLSYSFENLNAQWQTLENNDPDSVALHRQLIEEAAGLVDTLKMPSRASGLSYFIFYSYFTVFSSK